MKVYALIGKSGTGKSYQAINLCKEKEIESIIDDGLFIYRGKAMAGNSAKREATKIGAVKRALFNDEEHEKEVSREIERIKPESLLIIGTSEGMVDKIAQKLKLGHIYKKIYIQEITTDSERKIADRQRNIQGKHVIPVSSMQLKHEFSGYFLSPLRIFKGIGAGRGSFTEKSVVRPTYSYMGDFIISDRVISDIVKCTAKGIPNIKEVVRVVADENIEALEVIVWIVVKANGNIIEVAKELQKRSLFMIEEMTAFNIEKLNIEVRGII